MTKTALTELLRKAGAEPDLDTLATLAPAAYVALYEPDAAAYSLQRSQPVRPFQRED